MTSSVRPLTRRHIEARTELLLEAYQDTLGKLLLPPIPVSDIARYELGLWVEFDDLDRRFGVRTQGDPPHILGATFIDKDAVLIDHRLDPIKHPSRRHQFRFTLAHEIGHWSLHRSQVAKIRAQPPLFRLASGSTAICRRATFQKGRLEWQADQFAGCLLMPREAVWDQLEVLYGFLDAPLPSWDQRSDGEVGMRARRLARLHGLSKNEAETLAKRDIAVRPLAQMFDVSLPAMRIRAEEMGLLEMEFDVPHHALF